jgi:alkanesulfonate monooxygenase SsuD/methylene tetrahydromethanopterin reductase-like flavin-dependent oxidoreductase (luciferase family)
VLEKPYVMIGINVIAADTEEEARMLATSQEQQFLNLIRGRTGQLNPPVKSMDQLWSIQEQDIVRNQLSYTIVGNKVLVRERMQVVLDETQADEMMVSANIYKHQARLQSYRMLAEAVKGN